jgi:hypothetical protein
MLTLRRGLAGPAVPQFRTVWLGAEAKKAAEAAAAKDKMEEEAPIEIAKIAKKRSALSKKSRSIVKRKRSQSRCAFTPRPREIVGC